ncbi:SIN3-HDAC complex-associated factor-like [Actinia tenebrosa]|uniref:SIN3-HDAC complex-associated factor-like n=1 Tax=Actinia tenebrosa TaxID=6105 RepID=A0A6P8H5W5_ACTTE|nr:SIN3-HDAC complex-associated factor-like [Actinia tenebrosa]
MFGSHRPKVFRSRLGCCICGAKSSSSRFTSSTKYEEHFEGCFILDEKRQGEICNACVLLVKRWSRLPEGSTKNWKHVVNSKATIKRNTRPRRASKSKYSIENGESKAIEELDSTSVKKNGSTDPMETNDVEDQESECISHSPSPSDISEESSSGSLTPPEATTKSTTSAACQTSFLFPSLKSSAFNKLPYIDLSMWRQEEICCGMIFRGPCGEVLVDPKLLNPLCTCSTSQNKKIEYGATKGVCKVPSI